MTVHHKDTLGSELKSFQMNALRSIFVQVESLRDTIQPLVEGRNLMIEEALENYLKSAIVCWMQECTIQVQSVAASSHSSHQQVFEAE
jgi:hypothetical protein